MAYQSVVVVIREYLSVGNHSRTLREITRHGIVCESHRVELCVVRCFLEGDTSQQAVTVV